MAWAVSVAVVSMGDHSQEGVSSHRAPLVSAHLRTEEGGNGECELERRTSLVVLWEIGWERGGARARGSSAAMQAASCFPRGSQRFSRIARAGGAGVVEERVCAAVRAGQQSAQCLSA